MALVEVRGGVIDVFVELVFVPALGITHALSKGGGLSGLQSVGNIGTPQQINWTMNHNLVVITDAIAQEAQYLLNECVMSTAHKLQITPTVSFSCSSFESQLDHPYLYDRFASRFRCFVAKYQQGAGQRVQRLCSVSLPPPPESISSSSQSAGSVTPHGVSLAVNLASTACGLPHCLVPLDPAKAQVDAEIPCRTAEEPVQERRWPSKDVAPEVQGAVPKSGAQT